MNIMESITVKDIPQILEDIYPVRDQIVPCFIGSSGIGKTDSVYSFANKNSKNCVEMSLSQRMPNEISGLVMPNTEDKTMDVFDHAALSSLKDGDILFFDELFEAPEMVLKACLTLIQGRRLMSGKKLPDVMIVAATNPIDSPSLIKLSVRQRFMFFDVKFSKMDWSNYVRESLDISPTQSLVNQISEEGVEYNILTPRTAWKLLKFGKSIGCDGDESSESTKKFKWYCECLGLNSVAIKGFIESFDIHRGTNILKKALEEYQHYNRDSNNGIEGHIYTSIMNESLDINKMMELLSSSENFNKLKTHLENIELDTIKE